VNKKEKGENIMKANAKILSILMIASMMLGLFAILPLPAKADVPQIYVDPQDNIFDTSTMHVGSTFTVNVKVQNITNFAGLQFDLTWDPTLLNTTNTAIPRVPEEVLFHTITPPLYVDNIWKVALSYDNVLGKASYAYTWQDMGAAIAAGYCPANITTPIVVIPFGFKILKEPFAPGNVHCALHLSNVKASDPSASEIPLLQQDGYYELDYFEVPPLPPGTPYFTVIPVSYMASAIGEVFTIGVCVNNVTPANAAIGYEFKLSYDPTILSLISVAEGPWLPTYGAPPNQGTLWLTALGGIGYAVVGDVVMPMVNGTWSEPYPTAPEGNLVPMAIFTFSATARGTFPTVLSCPLHLYDTKVGDIFGESVSQGVSVDGFYSIKPIVTGRAVDIFVGQDGTPYPDPYGGQGPNVPADMFWPQKEVCAWVYVSYNQWPEQQKDVAIEIFDPMGTRWGIVYARTNSTGYAYVCFRLPWPCDNPEQFIGVWKLVATVDIACQIVNDTVWFHYDYLVRIWKVTADRTPASYNHTETACFTIEYGSHAQQSYDVVIALTALDETGVPFGFAYKMVTIGGTVFCQYKNYTDTLCVYIPKFARAGTGEVDVAILNDWPYLGGTVQSGFFDGTQWLGYAAVPIEIKPA
jgi:hypothetical protein